MSTHSEDLDRLRKYRSSSSKKTIKVLCRAVLAQKHHISSLQSQINDIHAMFDKSIVDPDEEEEETSVPVGGCFGCKECEERYGANHCRASSPEHLPAGYCIVTKFCEAGAFNPSEPNHPEWCPLK